MRVKILEYKCFMLLPIVFVLLITNGLAQNKCVVKGNVTINGGDLNDVKVILHKNNEFDSVKRIERNGKFSFQLDFGFNYIFEFSKKNFVTKRVSVSTDVPHEILEKDSWFPPCIFSIELFRFFPGIDLSVFDQSIGMIRYNKESDLIETDLSFRSEIKAELKRISEEVNLRQEVYLAEQATIDIEFNNAIKEGDGEFKKKNYINARLLYTKALSLKPTESYPNEQIFKIKNLLVN